MTVPNWSLPRLADQGFWRDALSEKSNAFGNKCVRIYQIKTITTCFQRLKLRRYGQQSLASPFMQRKQWSVNKAVENDGVEHDRDMAWKAGLEMALKVPHLVLSRNFRRLPHCIYRNSLQISAISPITKVPYNQHP